jgi:tetratricopeptide (TPR) repeat protein
MVPFAALWLAAQTSVFTQLQTARELKQKGAAAEAAAAYDVALPAVRASGDRKLLAQVLLESGQSMLAAGTYPGALARGEEAAALFHAQRDAANGASAENLAGSAQLYSGAYDGALEHYRRALALDRGQHDARGEINRLNNIANAHFFQGRYLEALENYQASLARAEENTHEPWGPGRRQLALTNLAILYEQLGQNQKALDLYKQALAGASALTPAERGQLLSNVGTLYRRLGDAVKALETYRKAQKLLEREHLSDAEIHVLQNVGIALALDLRDRHGAAQAFGEALVKAAATGNRRETVLAHLFRGEAAMRAAEWKSAKADFAAALAGARAIGAIEEEWTALYGQARVEQHEGRAAAALETLRAAIAKIESVRAGLGASSLKSDFLADKRDVYDAAIALTLDAGDRDPSALFVMFEQARSRNLKDALIGPAGPPSLKAVQERLAAGTVLLEYWTSARRIAILTITRRSTDVVSVSADDAMLQALPPALRGDGWREAAARAGRLLFQDMPLDMRRAVVVPDGVLYAIPFEALPMNSGKLAIEEMPISYLPSAAMLFREPPRDNLLMPWRTQLLALGDPVVDPAAVLAGDRLWARLPHAARELRSVAHAVPGRAAIHAGNDDRKRYLTVGTPLVHLATHALADTADANRSRILFTPEPGSKGSEYLFRAEVQSLPLAGTELVTLSACDTEAGAVVRGEGIQSFSRAFLAAGAHATLTTLWPVEDRATADFMQIFYGHLARGESKADALREAKLSFLRGGGLRAQPLYWAAFVLNGDGGEPIRPVLSWMWITGPLLAIAGVTAYRFLFLRHRRPHPKS